jgi:hypothetical protein
MVEPGVVDGRHNYGGTLTLDSPPTCNVRCLLKALGSWTSWPDMVGCFVFGKSVHNV